MDTLATVLLLAAINKGVVDYLGLPLEKRFPEFYEQWKFMLLYISFVTGVVLTLWSGVNVLVQIAPAVSDPLVGRVVTGLVVGVGANFIHDLTDKPL